MKNEVISRLNSMGWTDIKSLSVLISRFYLLARAIWRWGFCFTTVSPFFSKNSPNMAVEVKLVRPDNRPSNNGPIGFRYEHDRPSNNGPVDFRSCNNGPVGLRFQHNSPQWANPQCALQRSAGGAAAGTTIAPCHNGQILDQRRSATRVERGGV